MTHQEYRNAIFTLGLTQGAAARLFGVSLRTSSGWAIGDYRVPRSVAMLLEIFRDNPKLMRRYDGGAQSDAA